MDSITVYVPVRTFFDSDGRLIPPEITWDDGHNYPIDRVSDICQSSAMRAGGQGDRYTIWVDGKQIYLFFERNTKASGNNIGRWFVERQTA